MHLRTLRIRGFKSFPEPLEIALEPGVAVIVGPNGSGKSNIADAVVWAAGSLTPSELRAEKPDDVLFSGGGDRKPAAHCEVELVFANEDGAWPDLDFSEVAIARRLVRGSEGQYLVNRAAVRRTDLVELLSDVGLGAAMHSIVGQGKVEQVLASKPEDRREFVEEAAGLGKFKRRKHRAELKLARVAVQVERAHDVEEEVRKRLRPLALQATAAERAEKLAVEIASLRARIAELDLESAGERRGEAEARRDAAALARRGAQSRLEGLLGERTRSEDELSDAAGRREAAVAALYRLQAGGERLAVRAESAAALRDRLVAERELVGASSEDPAGSERASLAELRHAAAAATEASRIAAREREALTESARSAGERSAALERSLAEREGIAPAARALAESGERLALAAIKVEPGAERAVAAALGSRASAILVEDPASGLALLERARSEGLGSLVVLAGRNPSELVDAMPVVVLERLLEARVPSVTAEGFGYDPERGELWFSGVAAEAVLLEMEARRAALAEEARRLAEQAETAEERAVEAAARATSAEAAYASASATVASYSSVPRIAPSVLVRLASAAERLTDVLSRSLTTAARLESPLRARVDAGALRAKDLGEELRRLGAAEVELRRELEEASERLTTAEVELARIDGETEEARRRLDGAGPVEPADGDDRGELAAKAERLETRRAGLGMVNPLAREEYEAEKERLEDLRAQRLDLEQSLEELEKLRAELASTVELRFAETFAAVERHFRDVAATLFPGGEGRLRLVEAGDEEGAEAGIEVELRPAGKRVTRLSLLSGGEKALGAIAFLFSLFLARPCAFYLLDEVEAALDDSNIARFVELLRRYADRAQFVVVTHQKRTMEAADVLYGVTMGPDGVSQVVSRRLPRHEHAAA
ncbi:MAG TPA: AAA family ATPase [Gaiellaceae bacterium]|nr:AAA family ATPase [Gaiellaceae bacterium]